MRRSLIALLFAVLTLGAATTQAENKARTMSIRGWGQVIDPDGDCRVMVESARVSVTVPNTSHEFAAELEKWNAPRILRKINGDFIAQVKVCGDFEPAPGSGTTENRKPYHGGGLLLVADEQNHISLHRAAFREGDHVQNYPNFELRRDGKCVIDRYGMNIPPDQDLYVRIERHGDQFTGSFSPDGVKWKTYDPIESADFPTKAKIGAVVVNSTKEPFTCGFEEFSLFRKAGKTLRPTAESGVPPEGRRDDAKSYSP